MSGIPFVSYKKSTGKTDCPICSHSESVALSEWDRHFKPLVHVKCANCALLRQFPLPSDEVLEEYYKSEYRKAYQRVSKPSVRHRTKRMAEGTVRLDRVSSHLNGRGSSVLDFGCGSGEFVELCSSRGLDAMGFEPGDAYATHAREQLKLDVIAASWQDVVLDRKFDLVTSFHVFEHLTDPIAALERMKTWANQDGLFYIEVPNLRNGLHKGFGCLHYAHTLGFSKFSLEYLGAVAGLEVVDTYDEYDIGLLFRRGTPRDIKQIAGDARNEMVDWTLSRVHRQFWRYTFGKLLGDRTRYLKTKQLTELK
ncbi:MAG: class I SAM-dependent methyltransferase [Rhodobacteraceae bacterium]|nr:class I SAM-dependent methyltransferase [Paracoccaceae bacterium]